MLLTLVAHILCLSLHLVKTNPATQNGVDSRRYEDKQVPRDRLQRMDHEQERKAKLDNYVIKKRKTFVVTPAFDMDIKTNKQNKIIHPVLRFTEILDYGVMKNELTTVEHKNNIVMGKVDVTATKPGTHDLDTGYATMRSLTFKDVEAVEQQHVPMLNVLEKQNEMIERLVSLYEKELKRNKYNENKHRMNQVLRNTEYLRDGLNEATAAENATETTVAQTETETAAAEDETETTGAENETETTAAENDGTETTAAEDETETTAADNDESETTAAEDETETTAADNDESETTAAEDETETTAADNDESETTAAEDETETTAAENETETTAAENDETNSTSIETTTNTNQNFHEPTKKTPTDHYPTIPWVTVGPDQFPKTRREPIKFTIRGKKHQWLHGTVKPKHDIFTLDKIKVLEVLRKNPFINKIVEEANQEKAKYFKKKEAEQKFEKIRATATPWWRG